MTSPRPWYILDLMTGRYIQSAETSAIADKLAASENAIAGWNRYAIRRYR
jgi:hypothetical protein